MLSHHLPGKSIIDLARNDPDETELSAGAIDVHAFWGEGEILFYVLSRAGTPVTTEIDLSALLEDARAIEISVLEQDAGSADMDRSARDTVNDDLEAEVLRDMMIACELKPREIMQVIIRDIVPTEALAANYEIRLSETTLDAWEAHEASDAAGLSSMDDIEELDPQEEAQEVQASSDDGSWTGLAAALMLLPLLALIGG